MLFKRESFSAGVVTQKGINFYIIQQAKYEIIWEADFVENSFSDGRKFL
jgi:hypothetical protein